MTTTAEYDGTTTTTTTTSSFNEDETTIDDPITTTFTTAHPTTSSHTTTHPTTSLHTTAHPTTSLHTTAHPNTTYGLEANIPSSIYSTQKHSHPAENDISTVSTESQLTTQLRDVSTSASFRTDTTESINDLMTSEIPRTAITFSHEDAQTANETPLSNQSSYESLNDTLFVEGSSVIPMTLDDGNDLTLTSHPELTSLYSTTVKRFEDELAMRDQLTTVLQNNTIYDMTTTTIDFVTIDANYSSLPDFIETTTNETDKDVPLTTMAYVSKESTFSQYTTTTIITPDLTVSNNPYRTFCNTSNTRVVAWLGVPAFWWIVAAAVFVTVLLMIFTFCLYIVTSKRKWRKRSNQKRGYADDQLTSSFIQSYDNPEVTPTSRNSKDGKKQKPRKIKTKSYPKSYHLGPKLLPFPVDAVRLKPSHCSSLASTPSTFDSHKQLSSNGQLVQDFFSDKNGSNLKKTNELDNKEPNSGEDFGTWRKPGSAVFGGFIPGYKRPIFSNLHENDSLEKKPKKSADDDVFEAGVADDTTELTTFCLRNNTPNIPKAGSVTTFKS